MLLTFAFKDEEEIDRFSREMTFIINQDPIISTMVSPLSDTELTQSTC